MNTHSLIEENYIQKRTDFVATIAREIPDILALQEVNQSCSAPEVPIVALNGYYPCSPSTVIRSDNHVFHVVKLLQEKGIHYYWTWLPLKKGYNQYDEGIALMSLRPILETDILLTSSVDDYNNWKTRKLVGIRTEAAPTEWFYSVHYGWWNDAEEPLQAQWERTQLHMQKKGIVWLMGDFNSPAEVRGEGYDMITDSGWQDSYLLAQNKDSGITVGNVIDGWREKITDTKGMRIDQIWCNRKMPVKSSRVLFNGSTEPIVSDHYGIIMEYERN